MKRLNLTGYRKELEELKRLQAQANFCPFFWIEVREDGSIAAGQNAAEMTAPYQTVFDIPDPPGFSPETKVFLECAHVVPDGRYLPGGEFENGPYLPADPLLYYCNQQERKRFIDLAESGDYTAWMEQYAALIMSLQVRSISEPDMFLSGFDDPAVQDLIQNFQRFTPKELVRRYQDRRWFRGLITR